MRKLKLVILLFVFASQAFAQDVLHLCVGPDHNFGVPYTNGSSYYWQVQGDTTIATITSGNGTEYITIDLNNKGVFQLLVEEVDANGCNGYDSILVETHNLPNPNIFAVGPTTFCEGDSVLLQVDSAYSALLWNNNATSSYIYADTTANYFISVTDTNGCSNNSNLIFVNVYPSPIGSFEIDGICLGRSTYFTNTSTIPSGAITSSIWYLGNSEIFTSESVEYYYTELGEYNTSLLVISDFGCQDSINQIFSINSNPIADFSYSPFTVSIVNPEVVFTNTSINATPVVWSFNDTAYSFDESPVYAFSDPGIHEVWLTVEDDNQCIDSVQKQIKVYYDYILHIPSAFTPNKDGDNDTFGPYGWRMEKYQSYQFIIYNQWGDKVFETTDIEIKWDGLDAPVDTYSWVLIIKDELGELRKETGFVNLIR